MIVPALAGAITIGSVAFANSDSTAAVLTLQEAKDIAVEKVGGQVKEIELEHKSSGSYYEVEVVSDGIKYELRIDAQSGEVAMDDQPIKAALLTKEEAISIAKQKASGTVTEFEFDEDDDVPVYEIDMQDDSYKYEIELHAQTGEWLKFEKETLSKKSKSSPNVAPSATTTELSESQIVEIAKKKAKGIVTDIEREKDDGRVVYEVEMEDDQFEYEFKIDANTGEIIKFEKEKND